MHRYFFAISTSQLHLRVYSSLNYGHQNSNQTRKRIKPFIQISISLCSRCINSTGRFTIRLTFLIITRIDLSFIIRAVVLAILESHKCNYIEECMRSCMFVLCTFETQLCKLKGKETNVRYNSAVTTIRYRVCVLNNNCTYTCRCCDILIGLTRMLHGSRGKRNSGQLEPEQIPPFIDEFLHSVYVSVSFAVSFTFFSFFFCSLFSGQVGYE